MHIPIRPDGYSRLDQFDGLPPEFLPENLPAPVLARDVPLWRADAAQVVRAHTRLMEREQRAERRAELRMTLCVAAFIIAAAGVSAGTEWLVYILAVHP